MELLIADTKCTNILEYDLFQPLGNRLVGLNSVSHRLTDIIVKEFENVFSEYLCTYKAPLIWLSIDSDGNPIPCKAINVPVDMHSKIDTV